MDKSEIIEAIRAAAVNGRAPGQRRFSQVTGMRIGEWSRYWPRWSDAVHEAGLEPSPPTVRMPEDALLSAYAVAVRRYGRLPTSREMRLDSKAGLMPGFVTFRRAFGVQRDVVAAVQRFCRDNSEWADVLKLLPDPASLETHLAWSYVRPPDYSPAPYPGLARVHQYRRGPVDPPLLPPWITGVVYMMRAGSYYKIGRSNNVRRRLQDLLVQSPFPLRLVHVISTDDPPGIESYWHRRFRAYRARGEWFRLQAAHVVEFRRRLVM